MSEASPEAVEDSPGPGVQSAREGTRAAMRRANTAVALVIVAVLGLALAATWQGLRATRLQDTAERQQRRAEAAEDTARLELWRALVAEARATRLGFSLERREAVLSSVRRAAAIAPGRPLLDEAVAALALPEFRLESRLDLDPAWRSREFDPDLRRVAVGLPDGAVSVRRISDGGEVKRLVPEVGTPLAAQGRAELMEFDPSGRRLSVRYRGGALAVWDLEEPRPVLVRDADQWRRPASRGRFSDDGRHIVGPVFDPDGFAVIEIETGRLVAHFPEVGSFHHGAVRPRHRQFAAYDGVRVLLIDWEARRVVDRFPFPAGCRWLGWSPDGSRLAVVGNHPSVHVWEVDTRRLQELPGHRDDVYDAQFSPGGETLATSGLDGGSRIWDLRSGRMVGQTTDRHLVRWDAGGRSGWSMPGRGIEVRRRMPGRVFEEWPARPGSEGILSLPTVASGGRWAVGASASGGLQVWNLADPERSAFLPMPGLRSAAFDPVGGQVLLLRDRRVESGDLVESGDGVQLLNGTSLDVVGGQAVDLVTCSANGRVRAYVQLASGTVWLTRVDVPGAPLEIPGLVHSSVDDRIGSPWGAGTLALSPDGRWLACGADGTLGLVVVDAGSGERVATLDENPGEVQFSADGRWLLFSWSGGCRLHRVSDWAAVWSHAGHPTAGSRIGAAAVAPDGRLVAHATEANAIDLIDAETGRELLRLEAPSGHPISGLRWIDGPGRLVAATASGGLEVWSPAGLRHELNQLGLDWTTEAAAPRVPRDPGVPSSPGPPRWIAVVLFVTAGVVAAVSLIALGRHRRLIDDYSRTEALALDRERQLRMEREIGRLKSRFVSIVSHEFRTPLGVIMSAVELLRNYGGRLSDPKRVELHEDIFGATRRMAAIMEQVLLLGRVEGGRHPVRSDPVDLRGLATRWVDECRSATGARCPLVFVPSGNLEGAVGDEGLLGHVVTNLLSNAVKYSPDGAGVELGVRRDGRRAVFTVRDHGIGIPVEDAPRLFEAFQRGGNVGSIQGTGLGLLIVKRCADILDGTVTLQAAPGGGTVAVFAVPMWTGA